jgi:hypothetical protein
MKGPQSAFNTNLHVYKYITKNYLWKWEFGNGHDRATNLIFLATMWLSQTALYGKHW